MDAPVTEEVTERLRRECGTSVTRQFLGNAILKEEGPACRDEVTNIRVTWGKMKYVEVARKSVNIGEVALASMVKIIYSHMIIWPRGGGSTG